MTNDRRLTAGCSTWKAARLRRSRCPWSSQITPCLPGTLEERSTLADRSGHPASRIPHAINMSPVLVWLVNKRPFGVRCQYESFIRGRLLYLFEHFCQVSECSGLIDDTFRVWSHSILMRCMIGIGNKHEYEVTIHTYVWPRNAWAAGAALLVCSRVLLLIAVYQHHAPLHPLGSSTYDTTRWTNNNGYEYLKKFIYPTRTQTRTNMPNSLLANKPRIILGIFSEGSLSLGIFSGNVYHEWSY